MIYRKCSAGYDVKMYRAPYGAKEIEKIGKIPNGRFCVVDEGKILYEESNFGEAEDVLVAGCSDHHEEHEQQHGRFVIGKHALRDGVVRDL